MGQSNLVGFTGLNYTIEQQSLIPGKQSLTPGNVYRVQFRQNGTTSGCGLPKGCSSLPGPVLTQSELFNVTVPGSSVSQPSRSSSVPPSSVSSQNVGIDTTPSSTLVTAVGPLSSSATDSSPSLRSKPAGAIAGGVIGGLVCLAVAGVFIICFFRRSRAKRVEGHADGYEIPRPTEENNVPEYLTGGTREDGPLDLEKRGLQNMTDINKRFFPGTNGSSFPESASLLSLSRDGRPHTPATELDAPEAHELAVVSGPVGAPPPGDSSAEHTAVEDDGDEMEQRPPEEIRRELRMLREEVRRFRSGGPTPEWLDSLPNDIPPPEYASSPDPEMRLWRG